MEVCSTEELIYLCTVLRGSWARFEDCNDRGEEVFVSRDESLLYTLEESTSHNCEKPFRLVQGLLSNVTDDLRSMSKSFPKDTCNAVLFLDLYTMVSKNEWEWTTRLEQQPTGPLTRLDSFREQKKGEAGSNFEVTTAAVRGALSSDSGSDFDSAVVYVSQSITREHPGNSSASFETSVAVLLQASKPYFRLHSGTSISLVRGGGSGASAVILHGTVQLVREDPPYSLRRMRRFKSFARDKLTVRGVENIVELIADSLRPGELAIRFCTV